MPQRTYTIPAGALVEVKRLNASSGWIEHRVKAEMRFDEYRVTDLGYAWSVEHLDYVIRVEKPRQKVAVDPSAWVELEDCTILRRTERALLVHYEDEGRWVPLTQIHNADDLEADDEGVTVVVSRWFAKQAGLTAP